MLQLELKNELTNKRIKKKKNPILMKRLYLTIPLFWSIGLFIRVQRFSVAGLFLRPGIVDKTESPLHLTHILSHTIQDLFEIICILMLMYFSGCNFLHPCAEQSRSSVN